MAVPPFSPQYCFESDAIAKCVEAGFLNPPARHSGGHNHYISKQYYEKLPNHINSSVRKNIEPFSRFLAELVQKV